MKNKRGQGISMNMIIIIILAILVLLVVSIIFLGGAGTLNQRLKNIFNTNAGGTDADLARANCQNYCDIARTLPESAQPESAYCVHAFKDVDLEGDGKINGNYACDYANNAVVTGSSLPITQLDGGLKVPCPEVDCNP